MNYLPVRTWTYVITEVERKPQKRFETGHRTPVMPLPTIAAAQAWATDNWPGVRNFEIAAIDGDDVVAWHRADGRKVKTIPTKLAARLHWPGRNWEVVSAQT